MENFGKRLKALRRAKGMTQAQLAQASKIHLNQLVRYETGRAQPMLAAIQSLATVLQCSSDALLFDQTPDSLSPDLLRQFQLVNTLPEDGQAHIAQTLEVMVSFYTAQSARKAVQES